MPHACLYSGGDREDAIQTGDGLNILDVCLGEGLSNYRRACYGRDLNTMNLKEVFKAIICAKEHGQKRKRGTSLISPLDLSLNWSQSDFISDNAGIISSCSCSS